MEFTPPTSEDASRVLVIADWAADPDSVVAACRRRIAAGDAVLAMVVPAWLHGVDWAGDPYASRPCARLQAEALMEAARAARLPVESSAVGDPDPGSAVGDALHGFPATEILLCRDRARIRHPLDLAHRLRRSTGLPVTVPPLVAPARLRERRVGRALVARRAHCAPGVARSV